MRSGILAGATVLALLAAPTLAAEYLGGLVVTREFNGRVLLTNGFGISLYTFDRDEPGVSNCYDTCAENWPPFYANANVEPEGDFTIVERTDGTRMWAYKDAPLYYWRGDVLVGDVTGDGVGGVWRLAVE